MSDLFRVLARSSDGELERRMRSAASPDLRAIVGYEWQGYNTPIVTILIGNRKFIKVFIEGADGGVRGHNYFAAGTSLDEPWERRGSIVGRYGVRPSGAFSHPQYSRAALIDYGLERDQSALLRALRDYIVQPEPSDPDVLLGKAFFSFGSVALPAGYFVLGRLRTYRED